MDAARQILRFSIPGSLLLLHGIACFFIYRCCQGVSFIEASAFLRENIGALVAVLATIPIGFVVYQAYYFSYSPVVEVWPKKWRGRIVRADRGWQILSSFEESQVKTLATILGIEIDVREPHNVVGNPEHWYENPRQKLMHWLGLLELTGEWKDIPMEDSQRQEAYEQRWYNNWDTVRSILDIVGSIPGSQIKSEYTTLSDIYHAVGAARAAPIIAWGLTVVLAFVHIDRIVDGPAGSFAGLFLISALTLALSVVLHRARRQTWRSAAASLQLGMRWAFWRHPKEFASGEGPAAAAPGQ